nr:hypothetical protein [uncultured Celeribacter sp.]
MACAELADDYTFCIDVSDVTASTIATVIIACLTFCLFFLQYRQHRHDKLVTNANYKLALHDKRLETLQEIKEVLGNLFRAGEPSLEDAFRLRQHLQTARYVFPGEVTDFIEEMSSKAFEHYKQVQIWEPLRKRAFNGETLSAHENKTKEDALAKAHEIERWFFDLARGTRLNDKLDPYLMLPTTL